MGFSWLILADDLTGAADSSVGFACRGQPTVVCWDERAAEVAAGATVLSLSTDSRGLPAVEAQARVALALDGKLSRGTRLFKKIDSTLRGNPAAEVAAALGGVRAVHGKAFGVVCPAFPKNGRTVVGGSVFLNGRPLEESELWKREHTYPDANLVRVFGSTGLRVSHLTLEEVRTVPLLHDRLASLSLEADGLVVCDAVTDEDLAAIAAAARGPAVQCFVGAGGLSQALAALEQPKAAPLIALEPTRGGCLLVVGSFATASRNAARFLASTGRVFFVPVSPEVLTTGTERSERSLLAARVLEALDSGDDVLVKILMGTAPDPSGGRRMTESLAQVLRPAAHHASALVLTGGETAGVILNAFGVAGIRLHEEILPGICLGTTVGALTVPVITKAGSFGAVDCLRQCLEHLRLLSLGLQPSR
jgi:D-threonate/D-erythronate kinase